MKINAKKFLLNTYLSLFIFCMINREFLLFGIDLRFVVFPLGILLIISNIISNRGILRVRRNKNYNQFNYLMLFYFWTFICNISWIWNGLPMDTTKFINELILIMNIFISIIVIRLYEDNISSSYIKKNIVISSLVLVLSMILVSLGFSASQISASLDAPIKYESLNGVTNSNLLGWNYRPAGYASDPNYATLLMLIASCCVVKFDISKIKKSILMLPFLIGIALAFSRTILMAVFFTIVYIFFLRAIIKNKAASILLTEVLLALFIILSALAPFISELRNILPATMTTRLSMWESAVRLFLRSPLIGSGITGARSFFSINHWFVQTHDTYLQILSETGTIGIVLFFLLMSNTMKRNYDNAIDFFITIVFMIFMIDFESIALQFFLYVVLLCQIGRKEKT